MMRLTSFGLAMMVMTACSDDNTISSDEAARRAYLGLDGSVGQSLTLGFAGFNSATNANISPQMAAGASDGTLTITGQVDQGSSDNKGMRLHVGMVGYTDGPVVIDTDNNTIEITYDTDADVTTQPFLSLSLRNIPNGTLTGTLMGTYHMHGDLEGDATLNLTMSGTIQDGGGGLVVRVPGSTTVTGTATNPDGGTYDVNLTL
jgi:hypothetical protein